MNVGQKVKAQVRERATILVAARLLSNVFRPSYYPLMGFFILLLFTYLSQLPWAYKVGLLIIVYLFTVFIPSVGVYAYRMTRKLSRQDLQLRQRPGRRSPQDLQPPALLLHQEAAGHGSAAPGGVFFLFRQKALAVPAQDCPVAEL